VPLAKVHSLSSHDGNMDTENKSYQADSYYVHTERQLSLSPETSGKVPKGSTDPPVWRPQQQLEASKSKKLSFR
jgi:hypothetical protein